MIRAGTFCAHITASDWFVWAYLLSSRLSAGVTNTAGFNEQVPLPGPKQLPSRRAGSEAADPT